MIETEKETPDVYQIVQRRVVYSYPGPEWAGDLRNLMIKDGFTIIKSDDPEEVIGERVVSSPFHQASE